MPGIVTIPPQASSVWQPPVADAADLPSTAQVGDLRLNLDTESLVYWNGVAWAPVGGGGTFNGDMGTGTLSFDSGLANGLASMTVASDRLRVTASRVMEFNPNNDVTLYVAKGSGVYSQISAIDADYILEAGAGSIGSLWWATHGVGDIGKTTKQAVPFPGPQGPRDIYLNRNILFGDGSLGSGLKYSSPSTSRLKAHFNQVDFYSLDDAYYMEVIMNTSGTHKVQTNADLWLNDGAKMIYYSGTAAKKQAGNATLVGGTVTVSNTTVGANTVIQLTRKTAGGVIGDLTYTINAGTSFTIDSASASDTSVVTWTLAEVQ